MGLPALGSTLPLRLGPPLTREAAVRDAAAIAPPGVRRRLRRRATAVAAAASVPAPAAPPTAVDSAAAAAGGPRKYTRHYGVPVVTEYIRYREALDAVTRGEVREVVWSAADGAERALLCFKSGKLRLVHLPTNDVDLIDLMGRHGVSASMAVPEPAPPSVGFRKALNDTADKWLPMALLAFIWAVAEFRRRTKGDFEDRQKLEAVEAADKARRAAQAAALRTAAMLSGAGGKTGTGTGSGSGPLADEEANEAQKELDAAMDFLRAGTVKVVAAKRRRAANPESGSLTPATPEPPRVTFNDVAGIDEAKTELLEVVDFFLKPEKYIASGSRIPRGVLLVGPPGTGKTLLARAVAGEAGVNFFTMSGSEFVEIFVGVGASRVRDLFAMARKRAPAIVFIDELDAVGRRRSGKGNSGIQEHETTLNQLLTEMDGIQQKVTRDGVVVLAATNRPDVLDPALVRSGRFDRKVLVPAPSLAGRAAILAVHASRLPMAPDVDLQQLAFDASGYTGAGLANLLNLAALVAARGRRQSVTQADCVEALELTSLGRTLEEEYSPGLKRRLAAVEGGRALAIELLPGLESVELVTIVPRVLAPHGQLLLLADAEHAGCLLFPRRMLDQQLVAALAGRAAEEMLFAWDDVSVVTEPHLHIARQIAAKMVFAAGMTGPGEPQPSGLEGRVLSLPAQAGGYLGDATLQILPPEAPVGLLEAADGRCHELLDSARVRAKSLLQSHRPALDAVVDALVTRGTLKGDELRAIMAANGAPPKSAEGAEAGGGAAAAAHQLARA